MRRFWNTKEGKRILYVTAIVVVAIAARMVFLEQESPATVEQVDRRVSVASVLDLSSGAVPLPTVGRVTSQAEAVIRTEAAGEVAVVRKEVGDSVRAGEVIAEIENASQRAEVLRAQGVLQAAQANVLKLQNGSTESRTLIREAVRTSFTVADDAVRNRADQFITDPETATPEITVASSDYFVRTRAESARADLNDMFTDWRTSLESIDRVTSTEALVVYVLTAQANLGQVRAFLDDMAIIVAGYEPNSTLSQSTIDKWRGDISSARSSVNASLNSLVSSYNGLRSQIDASNGGGEDLLVAQAQVTQAEAGVLAAQASLEKTIIRSPIAGQVNDITINRGDFVSALQEVAIVANNGSLEVITSVNEQDRKTIAVGSGVLIDAQYRGVVTRIAPAVNRETGKIEVAVGIDAAPTLTNGQSVSLEIERAVRADTNDVMTIPVTALKITADGNSVFSVEQGVLVARPVSVGSIIGEKIIITDGLTPAMEIVVDARGLKVGQRVTVR